MEPRRALGIGWAATATIGLAMIIAALTLMPSPPGAGTVSDEVAHLLAFAALAAPLSAVRVRYSAFVFIGVSAYGAGIELLQPFAGRDAEWSFGMDVEVR